MANNNGKVDDLANNVLALEPDDLRTFYTKVLHPEPAEDPPDPWQPFTLADCYKPRPPITCLAGKLFELPSLNIFYGAPGTLKTFILADAAVSIAGHLPFLPPAPWQKGGSAMPTNQAPVIWCDFDNGRRRTLDRFAALGRGRNLPEDLPITLYSMPMPWLKSTDLLSIGSLAQRAKARGAGLIVIDNLGAVLGDAEENSGDMAKVMSHYRQLAEDTCAAVVLIHHQRKSSGFNGRAGDSLRGHSSIEAALDLALLVEREPYSETATITATKTRGNDVLPFNVQFTFDRDQAGEMVSAKFFGIGIEDNSSSSAIEREIKAALIDQPLNKTALTKAVKEALSDVGLNRIRNSIEKMVGEGKLIEEKGEKTERIYKHV